MYVYYYMPINIYYTYICICISTAHNSAKSLTLDAPIVNLLITILVLNFRLNHIKFCWFCVVQVIIIIIITKHLPSC